MEKSIKNLLEENEHILWIERPQLSVISRDEKRSFMQLIVFVSFFLLWFLPYLFNSGTISSAALITIVPVVSIIAVLLCLIWVFVKKHNLFIVTDRRIIRVTHYLSRKVVQRKLSELKYYNYTSKNGKGDVFFGPYEVTLPGSMLEYDYGYTVGNANSHIWAHYEKYMGMTLHFFSVDHVDELITILKERTSAVKFEKK